MSRQIAFVLLEDPVTLQPDALAETLRQQHPSLRWEIPSPAASEHAGDTTIIRAGDHLVVIAQMPAPLPDDEDLWQRASWIWPDAMHAARRHRAHLLVSTLGPAENKTAAAASLTAAEDALTTAAVVGGLLTMLSGALGVVWDGKVARSREMWLAQFQQQPSGVYPDHTSALWLDVVPFVSGQTFCVRTFGLATFIGREIEFEVDGVDRATAIGRVASLAFYLIDHGLGATIKDGVVFEADSEMPKVRLIYQTSRFTGEPVLSISPADDTSGKSKQYPIIPASIVRDHPLLAMLSKVGLFDAAKPENQIALRPDHYVSEVRLESYDRGITDVLSKILATDAYAEADAQARRALASAQVETAKSLLMPFAKEVEKFQGAARLALTRGDLLMFLAKAPRST